ASRPGQAPNLLSNPRDVIFSVANYLRQHGWEPGIPVFVQASLPPQATALATGGLEPTLSWAQLEAAGARPAPAPAAGLISGSLPLDARQAHLKLGVIPLEHA